jgi:hypothetical protein
MATAGSSGPNSREERRPGARAPSQKDAPTKVPRTAQNGKTRPPKRPGTKQPNENKPRRKRSRRPGNEAGQDCSSNAAAARPQEKAGLAVIQKRPSRRLLPALQIKAPQMMVKVRFLNDRFR